MEFRMKANGCKVKDRALGLRYGQIIVNIWENGKVIKPMEKAFYIMLTEIYMRVNGSMTKHVEKEHIPIKMEQNTLDNGNKTNKMDLESSNGLMVKSIRDNTKMELNAGRVF